MRTNMKKSGKEFVNTRWAIRRDFPTIVQINNQSLPEITEDYLIQLHRNPQKPVSLVAEIKEIVVGFVIYFVRSNRYELVHIATDETYQRMGIATVLINNLKLKLTPSQEKTAQKDVYNYSMQSTSRSKISVTVPDHLLSAHLFLRANGFHGQITDNDSYRFEYKI
jgi:ribosomal protein S18 acetylase RimI-like enzyme